MAGSRYYRLLAIILMGWLALEGRGGEEEEDGRWTVVEEMKRNTEGGAPGSSHGGQGEQGVLMTLIMCALLFLPRAL
jgi:hypothetical protein